MASHEAQAEIARGILARDSGNPDAAIKAFEAAIGMDAESPGGFLYLADMQLRQRRYKQAIGTANTALGMNGTPRNRSFGLQVLTLANINLRRRKPALAAGADAVRNDPQNAYNHRVHAQALWLNQKYKLADQAFRQCLALAPSDVSDLVAYARFQKATGKRREAEETVARAALVEPDATDVLLLRGEFAFAARRVGEARDLALWVLSRNANNRKALELMAQIKSYRSWLTRPFWSLATMRIRYTKAGFFAFGVIAVGLAGLCGYIFGGDPDQVMDAYGGDILILLVLYTLACALHVSWLVRRDLRQVKLRRDF